MKKYRVGGQNPPQEKPKAKVLVGPPKPKGYKYPTEEERREAAGERAYVKLKKQVDREVEQMRKDGATEAQIEKHANAVLSKLGR